MWKQLIAPTLLVAGLWVAVSPLTTLFSYWLDQSFQRALDQHVTVVQTSGQIRENVWRLLSYSNSTHRSSADEMGFIVPESAMNIEQALTELRSVAAAAECQHLAHKLESQWEDLRAQMQSGTAQAMDELWIHSPKSIATAEAIALTADQIRLAQEKKWTFAENQRRQWRTTIYVTRFAFVILGPALGIALGWWISQRFHRSISQINIILKDATVEWEQSLAKLRLSGREDLADLRERVEKVVERMRQVSAELDRARQESVRSERLAAVGELAAGVAHELRNPLTSVKLLLQNAAQQPGETRLSDDAVCVVLDEVQRMENTIQGLLDFSRPPSPQLQRHDLRDTLQRSLNLIQGRAHQENVRIETTLPDRPLYVDGDPEQLHQVCVNLLINGIEAEAGGILEIDAEEDEQNSILRLRFRDSGPGISNKAMDHLFEPFFSTKQRGTGLGLAISRRIVVQHGGKLTADNHEERGAVLTLELPIAPMNDNPTPETNRQRPLASAAR